MELYPPHICQSDEWGEFKTCMGTKAVRAGKTLFTIHPLPFGAYNVGYCARAQEANIDLDDLYNVGKNVHCSHIKIDVPNAPQDYTISSDKFDLRMSKPTFSTATFMVDLAKSESTLLSQMHHKTRYNIKLSQKKGVRVAQNSVLDSFLSLQKETARRQKFFVHPDGYYELLFKLFSEKQMAYLLEASYNNEVLSSLFLIKYQDTLYYPYGGSVNHHRELMAPTLNMWEAIRLGQSLGCKQFDMWGALDAVIPDHPWAGFHRFKEGFGGELVKYPGSWDLIIDPKIYNLFKLADKVRWGVLRALKR